MTEGTSHLVVTEADLVGLAGLRSTMRRYLAWAEQVAREHDMTTAQVQLALAVRAHPDPAGPTLTDLAETLLLRHHSVVGLVDRAQHAGLVRRERDAENGTRVHVRLTAAGTRRIEELAAEHVRWLGEHGEELVDACGVFTRPG